MSCSNRHEDFFAVPTLCDHNGICKTPNCPYGDVGLHPSRPVQAGMALVI